MTVSLFAQHQVKDFATWKTFYDENAREALKKGGVLTDTVHRNIEDPNSVLVYHQFADTDSLNAFVAFFDSDEAREMSKVTGTIMESINIWVGEDI
ncbi:MAG: hypothetical protein AAF633_20840 [Chloroflexota bacterium]